MVCHGFDGPETGRGAEVQIADRVHLIRHESAQSHERSSHSSDIVDDEEPRLCAFPLDWEELDEVICVGIFSLHQLPTLLADRIDDQRSKLSDCGSWNKERVKYMKLNKGSRAYLKYMLFSPMCTLKVFDIVPAACTAIREFMPTENRSLVTPKVPGSTLRMAEKMLRSSRSTSGLRRGKILRGLRSEWSEVELEECLAVDLAAARFRERWYDGEKRWVHEPRKTLSDMELESLLLVLDVGRESRSQLNKGDKSWGRPVWCGSPLLLSGRRGIERERPQSQEAQFVVRVT